MRDRARRQRVVHINLGPDPGPLHRRDDPAFFLKGSHRGFSFIDQPGPAERWGCWILSSGFGWCSVRTSRLRERHMMKPRHGRSRLAGPRIGPALPTSQLACRRQVGSTRQKAGIVGSDTSINHMLLYENRNRHRFLLVSVMMPKPERPRQPPSEIHLASRGRYARITKTE